MDSRGSLVIISGFSGVGKGTVMKKLLEMYPAQYALSVSATTRKPREGEQDGVHYFFKTREEFEQMISENALVEYACYCDNYYGTPRAFVEERLEKGQDVILEIEIQGALQIKKMFPETLLLFVMPPSADELSRRLIGRGTETREVIRDRLARAVRESEGIEAYDYVVVNDVPEGCAQQIHEIVQTCRCRTSRNIEFISEICNQITVFEKGE